MNPTTTLNYILPTNELDDDEPDIDGRQDDPLWALRGNDP